MTGNGPRTTEQEEIEAFWRLFPDKAAYFGDRGEQFERAEGFLDMAQGQDPCWEDLEDVAIKYVRRVEDMELNTTLAKDVAFSDEKAYYGIGVPSNKVRFEEKLRIRMLETMDRVRFGAAHALFDPACWVQDTEDDEALILVEGKKPSEGIAALGQYRKQIANVEGLETAKLDCVEAIEFCRWLAELDVIGVPAFDKKYGSEKFSLCAPGSTGIDSRTLGVRTGGSGDTEYDAAGGVMTGTFELRGGPYDGQSRELAKLLPKLPVGSRVMWRNFDKEVSMDHDFKNENTMKISKTEYAAHPLGTGTLETMRRLVAQAGFDDMTVAEQEESERLGAYYAGVKTLQDYIGKFIRIVEFETFETPFEID